MRCASVRYLLVVMCVVGVAVAGCDGGHHAASSIQQPGRQKVPQCRHGGATALIVGTDGLAAPIRLRVHSNLWLSFAAGNWSTPTSADPSVVQVRPVVRCGNGAMIAQLRARGVGSTHLDAGLNLTEVSLEWRPRVLVAPADLRRPEPPAVSRMIPGGGLLTYPQHLYQSGANLTFTAPHVTCPPGRSSRTTIGMFGIKHYTPPYRGAATAAWSAGLTITCPRTGGPILTVGYNGRAQDGRAQPGDVIHVDTSGAPCPSLALGLNVPHPKNAVGYSVGPLSLAGCRTGEHDQVRVDTLPTLLLGAQVHGGPPRIEITLRDVTINGQPYRMAPHQFREQLTDHHPTAHVHPSTNWYRLRLTIGKARR